MQLGQAGNQHLESGCHLCFAVLPLEAGGLPGEGVRGVCSGSGGEDASELSSDQNPARGVWHLFGQPRWGSCEGAPEIGACPGSEGWPRAVLAGEVLPEQCVTSALHLTKINLN